MVGDNYALAKALLLIWTASVRMSKTHIVNEGKLHHKGQKATRPKKGHKAKFKYKASNTYTGHNTYVSPSQNPFLNGYLVI